MRAGAGVTSGLARGELIKALRVGDSLDILVMSGGRA